MDTTQKAQKALQAAQQNAASHRAAAVQARLKAAQDASRASLLAQQQAQAAAALRHLEDQTGAAATTLADLDNQSQTAKQSLQQSEAALTALLPIMQRLSNQPAATMLAVPASPTDAIRGILVLQGIAAEIERRAEAVRAQAKIVASLQAQTVTQQAALAKAVVAQQQAEDALSSQISAEHSVETADLDTAAHAASAALADTQNIHDLQGMIDKLRARERAAEAAASQVPPANAKLPSQAGGANLLAGTGAAAAGAPVAGVIIQAYGAATVAGPAVGQIYRAAPGARVVAPCGGPVLFANKFQNYGLLVIMDCGGNYDFVLSGMQHLDVTAGQRITRGQPVGEMLAYNAKNPAQQPLLYVELRRNGTPVNPSSWLNTGGSG